MERGLAWRDGVLGDGFVDPVWPILTAQKPLVCLVAASSAQAMHYLENGQA